jgi:RimJ/RimL family protein N-acetyltransferase
VIKGNNINLRPMGNEDIEVFYNWNSNQEFMGEYMYAEIHYKEPFIDNIKKSFLSSNSFIMIIEDKEAKPLGIINYSNSAFSNVSVDFGILIADKSLRGKGVGREAIVLLVNYLFNSKNIMRIQFMTRSDNEGMKLLGERVGFRLEGIMRKYRFDHGECRDLCLYSLIRDDWRELHSIYES